MFANVAPRCEIDAAWKIVTFFGTASSKMHTNNINISRATSGSSGSTKYMFEFLKKLLFSKTGTLSHELSEDSDLPPCDEQLLTCCRELRIVGNFVKHNLFNPESDEILLKIITRTVALDESRCKFAPNRHYGWNGDENDLALVRNTWVRYDDYPHRKQLLAALQECDNDFIHSIGPLFSLLPSSGLLAGICRILIFWIEKNAQGKASWKRLKSSVNKITTNLISKATAIENDHSKGCMNNVNSLNVNSFDSLRAASSLRLASCYMIIVSKLREDTGSLKTVSCNSDM